MKDYQKQLDKFLNFPEYREPAEHYLNKYWLDKQELKEVWLKIKDVIYNPGFKVLPDPVFSHNFDTIILKGGSVLNKEEFEILQSCMKVIGEKYLLLVEDYDEEISPINAGPAFRFKYPVDITWEKIMSGGEISFDVFLRPIRNFFVFGDSGQWGRYVGNDYDSPLDIIGFNRKYSDLFHDKIKIPKEDIEDLKEWVASYGMKLPGFD
jgi:hypothetical protein